MGKEPSLQPLSFSPIKSYPFIREKVKKLPYLFAKEHGILALEEKGDRIVLAIGDPFQFKGLDEARMLLDKEIELSVFPPEAIEEGLQYCYHEKEEVLLETKENLPPSSEEESIGEYDLLEELENNPVIRILNMVLREAIQQGASDIHFDSRASGLEIRYRIDGALQKRHSSASSYQAQIITRIKVMAKMDITQNRLPQDGRIKLKMGGKEIDFRVSTAPTVQGERVVLRVLDKGSGVLGLDRIGMNSKVITSFRKMMQFPEGIILVTGPTGSGKTTTLYSAISELNDPEKNIMTIEDPVEYKFPGIAQIQTNSKIGLNFSKGLRHILRQDPDIVLIGEIRDEETAEIAIQSALTGHLVLSTLHTNDAPSAITRLCDMGIEKYLLSSSLIGVVAQRLLRKICPHCRTSYTPSSEEMKELGCSVKQETLFFTGKGCDLCFGTGYKGRVGIYELMKITPAIKKQILSSADANELRKVAEKEKMVTLRQSGQKLVFDGTSSTKEVLRVVRGIE